MNNFLSGLFRSDGKSFFIHSGQFIFLLVLMISTVSELRAQEQHDLLIKNGRIIDGTGNSWFYGDILVRDGKIIRIRRKEESLATKVIDATGLVIAPGFIDVHTHIEGEELRTPTAENFIYDGVTSVVTGNCGASNIDIAAYFRFLDSLRLSVNVATLVGHNDVRKAVMGRANRKATAEELRQMATLVDRAMKEGAVGLSTGLIYIPGAYAPSAEVIQLAVVAAAHHGIYATHMRNEGDSVVEAINEAISIGREAKIPVQISHFIVSGQQIWKRSSETLALIKAARDAGIEVTIDQYPYTASSTSLSTLLPDGVLSDGSDSLSARLQRPGLRKWVVEEMLKSLRKRKLKHFSYAVVGSFNADPGLNGKSIEEINLIRGRKHKARAEAETILDMMLQGGAGMIFHGMSEWDVKNIMQYPFSMFASDAAIRAFGQGVPHPRGYGTNARVLGKYVREEHIITLEEAIRRMTSLPAAKFAFNDRGMIKEGMAADIVIFDPRTVADKATFDKPHAYSTGFQYVIVNGQVVVDQGKHNGKRNGKLLYGPGKTSD